MGGWRKNGFGCEKMVFSAVICKKSTIFAHLKGKEAILNLKLMKPMLKYRGGKSKEIPHIMWYVPRFTGRYIEPFFGGGALFFHLMPREAIVNDINGKLMAFYSGVRDNYGALRKELDAVEKIYVQNRMAFDALKKEHPNERVEDGNERLYYRLRDMFNSLSGSEFSDALLYYFINKTAYSGMIRYNAKGEFNVPFGRYKNFNTKLITRGHSELLNRAQLFNTDFEDIFRMAREDDFMFLDPPYDCTFSDYGNAEYRDGFNEESHRRLAAAFKELPCKTLMIIGRTPLTEALYADFIMEDYEKKYAVNIRNRFKAAATHIVVANYVKDCDRPQPIPIRYTINQQPEVACAMLFEKDQMTYGKN